MRARMCYITELLRSFTLTEVISMRKYVMDKVAARSFVVEVMERVLDALDAKRYDYAVGLLEEAVLCLQEEEDDDEA